MREIKFRVYTERAGMIHFGFDRIGEVDTPGCIWNSDPIEQIVLDEEPVMQYTGLEDKAGVEIYDGDILEVGSLARRFSVEWGIGGFCTGGDVEDTMCRIDLRHLSTVYDSKMVMVEVIGNIHENPELIE